tara:strand:- start:4431 stop:5006 length:576 start_codon:yes stop_codon:yes gene_type:complete
MIKAILLAAGQSKRMKTKNKLLKNYKQKPLISYIINSLIKSKVNKIIIVIGYESEKLKKTIPKNKKINFIKNYKYSNGISSSIKTGLKKISKKDKGFIIAQSDMPFIKPSILNRIYNSISKKKYLVHVLKYKKKLGNPIGFDISTFNKFKKIKGDLGAKYMVKRLRNSTNFIEVKSKKIFKDFDKDSDFRN